MKPLHNILALIAAIAIIGGSSCKKYIDEYNPSGRTAETYFNTKSGFEDLAKSNYPNLRPITSSFNGLYYLGTDIFTTYTVGDVSNPLNNYTTSLNSSIGDVNGFWTQLYAAINVANSTLYWATQVKDLDNATLNIRIGEAKALRAYYYYLLAETFGDVPLKLERTTEAVLAYDRTPEKDVYDQIIKDLNDAVGVLPATTPDFGRITKGCAQHLLAKVYLTRGYKPYGAGVADFQQAATLAEAVIASTSYALKTKFADLFDPTITNFQVNPEVILSAQWSTNTTTGSTNNLHQYFLWDTQIVPLIGRSSLYGKPNYAASPDPYFFSLFDKVRDSRYAATFVNALLAQSAGAANGNTFAVGDTLIYYPDVAFTTAQKAAKKYFVFNPDEYRTSPFTAGVRTHPEFKKFRELNLPYGDNNGTRDTYIFRLAETYLIAAEAYLQSNNLPKALDRFNIIRARAAKTGTNPATGVLFSEEMKVTAVTLDTILEERARELAGEEFRWYELKRTGKLISRVLAYNDEAKTANSIKPIHLLRPLPQEQIDLTRSKLTQNTGY